MSKKTKKKTPSTVPVLVKPFPDAPELTEKELDDLANQLLPETPPTKTPPWGAYAVPKAPPKAPKSPSGVAQETSIFDGIFPMEPDSSWHKFEGIDGRVHDDELDAFKSVYGKCEISGKYVRRGNAISTVYGSVIGVSGLESKEFKENWVTCQNTGRMVKKIDTFKAKDCSGESVVIWKGRIDSYTKCDKTGDLYHAKHIAHLTDHPKYSYVGAHVAHQMDDVGQCGQCGRWVMADILKKVPDYGELCSTCAGVIKKKNAILKHNAPLPSGMKCINTPVKRLGYVKDKDGFIISTNEYSEIVTPRLFGVEIETELHKPAMVKHGIIRHDLALAVMDALGRDFVYVKEDGSLTLNGKYSGESEFDPEGSKNGPVYAGFEIVTAPCDLEVHRNRWGNMDLSDALHYGQSRNKYLRSWDTETCAMHVHVSKAPLTSLTIGRILRFINHPNNQKFIFKVAGRNPNKFCYYKERQLLDSIHPERVINDKLAPAEASEHNKSRRVAVNIRNPHTIEFRIFRGTVNPKHILRNLEFCDAVCSFCHPSTRSFKELMDYKYFVDYVGNNRKHWPLLASWFAVTGIIDLKPIKRPDKAAMEKLTIKLDCPETEFDPDKPFHPQPPPIEESELGIPLPI